MEELSFFPLTYMSRLATHIFLISTGVGPCHGPTDGAAGDGRSLHSCHAWDAADEQTGSDGRRCEDNGPKGSSDGDTDHSIGSLDGTCVSL